MNIIDCISNNIFLKKIFPDGINEEILIGHIGFDFGDRFSLRLNTKQKPSKKIEKWGDWKQDYDAMVISLLGTNIDNIEIKNWKNIHFAPLTCKANGDTFELHSEAHNWSLSFSFKTLIFQHCTPYIS